MYQNLIEMDKEDNVDIVILSPKIDFADYTKGFCCSDLKDLVNKVKDLMNETQKTKIVFIDDFYDVFAFSTGEERDQLKEMMNDDNNTYIIKGCGRK